MSASPDAMQADLQGAPAASPMLAPTEPAGQQATAKADVMIAMKMLEKALPSFGAQSPEGKAILTCIKGIAKTFGESEADTEEIIPAELKNILATMMGPGQPDEPDQSQAAPPAPAGGGAPPTQ